MTALGVTAVQGRALGVRRFSAARLGLSSRERRRVVSSTADASVFSLRHVRGGRCCPAAAQAAPLRSKGEAYFAVPGPE